MIINQLANISNDIKIFVNDVDNNPSKIKKLKNSDLEDKDSLDEESWHNFHSCVFTIQSSIYDSYTINLHSKIIQALFIQQIKLSKSILDLTSKQIRTGQATLSRLILEVHATISWLLKSSDINRFEAYIMHGLSMSTDTIKLIHKDSTDGKQRSAIQDRLIKASFNEFKMAELDRDEIDKFMSLSHNKINKKYKFPNFKERISLIDDSDRLYHMYAVSSSEIHSSFPEIIYQNIINDNGKFISNTNVNHNSSTPRSIDSICIMLIESFNLLIEHKVLNFDKCNGFNVKRLIKNVVILCENIIKIEHYDEKLLSQD